MSADTQEPRDRTRGGGSRDAARAHSELSVVAR